MSIFSILLYVAASTFALGWLVVIFDAITGFRLIEKLPPRLMSTFEAVHNAAWLFIGLILLAVFIVWLSGVGAWLK